MPKLNPDHLAEYCRLAADAQRAGRELRQAQERMKQIAADAEAELEAAGRDSIRRSGYTITFVEGRLNVPWKDHFIRIAGAEAANEVAERTPKPMRVQITPPKQATA